MSKGPLAGKTALVTGAARRLGRAIALSLAREGASLVIHYGRSGEAAQELVEEVRRGGGDAWLVGADLANPGQVESLLPRALEQAGRLDVLVNNASVFRADSLMDVNLDDMIENLKVNAWAPFALSRAFALHAGRGAIVNLLDTRVVSYDWKHVSYIVSKSALALLTRMTAVAYAPNIRVNAVAPGLILPPPGEDEGYLEKLADTVPLKRHGGSEDIAEAVVYLVKSDFVTGQVLYVDGGRHLLEYEGGPNSD